MHALHFYGKILATRKIGRQIAPDSLLAACFSRLVKDKSRTFEQILAFIDAPTPDAPSEPEVFVDSAVNRAMLYSVFLFLRKMPE